jgi:hypothetical protein
MKGCAIRLSRGIAVLGVSSLVLKLPWPSDYVCNGGTWKIPVRPGDASSVVRRAQRCFQKEIIANFPREFLGKKSGISRGKTGFVINIRQIR